MITELFCKRYEKISNDKICKNPDFDQVLLFNQIYGIIYEDLFPRLHQVVGQLTPSLDEISEKKFCREVGIQSLPNSYKNDGIGSTSLLNAKDRCQYFILKLEVDWRIKLSLIEILIREYEHKYHNEINSLNKPIKPRKKQSNSSGGNRPIITVPREGLKNTMNVMKKTYDEGINEINVRLFELGLMLRYSNGFFLPSEDNLSMQIIEKPFWDLVRNHPEYQSVESDMLEALDYRAQGKHDKAGLHAFMAFESALKIKFQVTVKTTFQKLVDGHLANYTAISKFLPLQYLKDQNSYFRNESSHGPGKQKRNFPLKEEVEFAISLCMSSIRLLLAKD